MENAVRESKVMQIFSSVNGLELQVAKLEQFIKSLSECGIENSKLSAADKPLPCVVSMWNNLPGEITGLSERIEKSIVSLRDIFV